MKKTAIFLSAICQKVKQGKFEGLVRPQDLVGDAVCHTKFADALLVGVNIGEVIGADFFGVDVEEVAGFEVFELGAVFVGEVEFGRIEDLKDDNFVACGAELAQRVGEGFVRRQ